MQPAMYYRRNKQWPKFLGKRGQVLLVTEIKTAAKEFEFALPYQYVLAEIDGQKMELMAADGEQLTVGDKVECVLRILTRESKSSLINYGLKLKKLGVY